MAIDPALFQENERLDPRAKAVRFAEVGELRCEAGGFLPSVTVAYETWGEPNSDRSNAVVICHALSGDSHAIGWWDRMVGPGRPIDTDRYFVIGTNSLGGCQGTTGPASPHPGDGAPWQTRFPIVTVGDMVEVQMRLVRILGIETLLAVAGGSMGGMQALEWTLREPGRVRRAFITASCAAHSAMQIGFNEAARQAVMRDPRWKGGHYDPGDPPAAGLAVARMLGHLSYLSEAAFDAKFGRRLQNKDTFDYHLGTEFQVESYLAHQGDKFTTRFDANSLLYLTRAIDYYERRSLQGSRSEYLFTSFDSDWIYPTHQSRALHEMALAAGCHSEHHEVSLPFGHDAFLLDGEHQGALVRRFLES
ncbi:MAG: homoserine O-acetyltransferase [Fimbriimonadaceae bacterium]|nr:homoserine O-acetyltransferase [Fimbriimonadaceae bacterium]